MANGNASVEVNRNIHLNWGMLNVPTLAGIAALGVMVYQSGQKQERQDSRLDAIELSRTARSIEVNKVLETLAGKVSPLDNIVYRVTIAEQNIADVNRRVDRQGDSMQSIRDDVASLSTNLEVIRQMLDVRLPPFKAGLDTTPKELVPGRN